jgi:hypothetical protein
MQAQPVPADHLFEKDAASNAAPGSVL